MLSKIKALWKYDGKAMAISNIVWPESEKSRKHRRNKLHARYALLNGVTK